MQPHKLDMHTYTQTQSVKLRLQTTKEQTQQQAPKATLNPASPPLQYLSSLSRATLSSTEPCYSLVFNIAGNMIKGKHTDNVCHPQEMEDTDVWPATDQPV